jgi:hypothetical protein
MFTITCHFNCPGPILSLEDEEKVQPFTYAFHTLAVCAGGGHVKRRRVMRLLDIINQPAETHNIGKANDVERTIYIEVYH